MRSRKEVDMVTSVLAVVVVVIFLVSYFAYSTYMKVTCDITEEKVLAEVTGKYYRRGYRTKSSYKPSRKKVTLTYLDISKTFSSRELYNNAEEGDYVEVYLVTYTSKKTGQVKKQKLSFEPCVKGDSKLPHKVVP